MDYNFYLKKIGQLDDALVEKLAEMLKARSYTTTTDFNPDIILVNNLLNQTDYEKALLEELLVNYLDALFSRSKLYNTTVSLMLPRTYLLEHSDHVSRERLQTFYKLHIPIVTNDKVGHMWRNSAEVFHMEKGGIYLFDNIRKHSAVNLSSEDRYHLMVRYTYGSEIDPSILL